MSKNDEIGPTGKFPNGKLTPDDLGELNVGIGLTDENIVIVDYGENPVAWVGLHPEAAIDFGRKLIEVAEEAKKRVANETRTRNDTAPD